MTKSPQKVISLLLALVLVAPVNAGAATWMALSMNSTINSVDASVTTDTASSTQHMVDDSHAHQSSHAHMTHVAHDLQQMDHQSHEHDGKHNEEDCNEHCISCANHCSSLGILSDNFMLSDLTKQSQRFESGNLNSFSDLLYRPPIHI